MPETIIVALLSLLGSLGGTLGGIVLNSKLSNSIGIYTTDFEGE